MFQAAASCASLVQRLYNVTQELVSISATLASAAQQDPSLVPFRDEATKALSRFLDNPVDDVLSLCDSAIESVMRLQNVSFFPNSQSTRPLRFSRTFFADPSPYSPIQSPLGVERATIRL